MTAESIGQRARLLDNEIRVRARASLARAQASAHRAWRRRGRLDGGWTARGPPLPRPARS